MQLDVDLEMEELSSELMADQQSPRAAERKREAGEDKWPV